MSAASLSPPPSEVAHLSSPRQHPARCPVPAPSMVLHTHCVDREEFLRIQVPRVDVGANLDPREAQLLYTALHLLDGQLGGLHGQRPQAHEPPGVPRYSGS